MVQGQYTVKIAIKSIDQRDFSKKDGKLIFTKSSNFFD
jgi:hypothetical protein